MTEKLSECCEAEVLVIYNDRANTTYLKCSSCKKPCTIASKPDASPDRLLTDEELQKFAVGYVDYPEKDGEIDWTNPKFQKGEIPKVWHEICKAQYSKTYPIAFEEGKKQGANELAEWALKTLMLSTAEDNLIRAKLKELGL